MIRKLIGNFRKSISERAAPRRHNYQLPLSVSFDPNKNLKNKNASVTNLSLRGETKDLSRTGIAFIVPTIRVREYYLVGENRPLDIELSLPHGKLKMQIIGQRYEQINDEHSSATSYLIGASIVQMDEDAREIYEEFLRLGMNTKMNTGKLQLGIDKS